MDMDSLSALIKKLLSENREAEWLEFKHNHGYRNKIGENISALANAAALHGKDKAYIIWGVDDKTHEIVGTSFSPKAEKIEKQDLELWLSLKLHPKVHFEFCEFEYNSLPVVLLCISPTKNGPVSFDGTRYIRVGSHSVPLTKYPEKEKILWSICSPVTFEQGIAKGSLSLEQSLELLDYRSFFRMSGLPPNLDGITRGEAICERLTNVGFLVKEQSDKYAITNLAALLFAHDVSSFDSNISRKAIRIIIYKDRNRIETIREKEIRKGYATGFEDVMDYLSDHLPTNELIGKALRQEKPMYPLIAIRELVANALIHQDLSLTGVSPMIEIFTDRIEISNPGTPLIDTMRFIDGSPVSRNEMIATLMRRLNICEERGSGIDKVVSYIELYQLPAPSFDKKENSFTATIYAHKLLRDMDKVDKIRACYQHACLCYVSGKMMTNTSLRERFGIESQNYSTASRIISDTLAEGLIKSQDTESNSKKHAKYVPFWS